MIKTIWRGWLFDGKKSPYISVENGTTIKLQGTGVNETATLKGVLSDDSMPVTIGLIRCKDLAKRKQLVTDDVYFADISGFKYITLQNQGFSKVYGVIYGDEDEKVPVETDVQEYHQIVIIDDYKQTVIVTKH